jgi:hypothetical protein
MRGQIVSYDQASQLYIVALAATTTTYRHQHLHCTTWNTHCAYISETILRQTHELKLIDMHAVLQHMYYVQVYMNATPSTI